MIRTVMLAAVLSAGGTAALACANADEATRRYDQALAAYFAVSAGLKPEQHATWSEALRTYQTAVQREDYDGACKALDAASVLIGI